MRQYIIVHLFTAHISSACRILVYRNGT